MTDGRLNNELNIQERIEKKLSGMPEFVYGWYLNLKASRRTAATCYDFIYKVYNFLHFINEDVKNVEAKEITERITTEYFLSIQTKIKDGKMLATSDSYQRTTWSCLNNFMDYLEKRNIIENNYIKLIQKPKNNDGQRIDEHRILLTEDDFKKIMEVADDGQNATRDKAILSVFMTTGMRKTALANIMLDDIDLSKGTLVVIDKGNKRQQYILSDYTLYLIDKWLRIRKTYVCDENDKHLFLSRRGTVMGGRTLTEIVQKYTGRALGKPLSPHKLRAGYCSILYNKTHDAEFVRRAVGHANVATTQRYIVTKGNERKKAAEIMASII